jgi:hypothetical protein
MLEAVENHIVFFYRSMMMFYDKWSSLSTNSVNNEALKLYQAFTQKPFTSHPSRLFKESITNFTELCNKTAFGRSTQKSNRVLALQKHSIVHVNPNSSSHHIKGVSFKRGQIYKKSTGFFQKGWSLRYAILDNNVLYYFEDDHETSNLKSSMSLAGSTIESDFDEERPNCFRVTDKLGNSQTFSGINDYDNEEWVSLMKLASQRKEEPTETSLNGIVQQSRFVTKEVKIPSTKIKEAQSFLGEIATSHLGLISVVNGVRIFGGPNIDLHNQIELNKRRSDKITKLQSTLDFILTKSRGSFDRRTGSNLHGDCRSDRLTSSHLLQRVLDDSPDRFHRLCSLFNLQGCHKK